VQKRGSEKNDMNEKSKRRKQGKKVGFRAEKGCGMACDIVYTFFILHALMVCLTCRRAWGQWQGGCGRRGPSGGPSSEKKKKHNPTIKQMKNEEKMNEIKMLFIQKRVLSEHTQILQLSQPLFFECHHMRTLIYLIEPRQAVLKLAQHGIVVVVLIQGCHLRPFFKLPNQHQPLSQQLDLCCCCCFLVLWFCVVVVMIVI
jgi:hypothetical protein